MQALTHDSFLFLKVVHDNIAKVTEVLSLFPFTSKLHIDMQKLVLIRCTKSDLVALGWCSQILDKGNVCQHLGYHTSVHISPSQSLKVYVLEVSNFVAWYSSQSGTRTNDSDNFYFLSLLRRQRNHLIIWLVY